MVTNGTNADICLTDTSINTLTTAHLYITPGLNVPSGTGLFIKSPEELRQNIVNVSSEVYQFAGLVYEVMSICFSRGLNNKLMNDDRSSPVEDLFIGYLLRKLYCAF